MTIGKVTTRHIEHDLALLAEQDRVRSIADGLPVLQWRPLKSFPFAPHPRADDLQKFREGDFGLGEQAQAPLLFGSKWPR